MSTERNPTLITHTDNSDVISHVDEILIEGIWRDLGGQVTRERIRQVATSVAAEFGDATVTTFLPIFIHRRTRAKLEDEAGQTLA